MKKIFATLTICAALALSACTTFRPVSSGSGVVGAKKGEATASYLFGLPLGQDNTMLAAANAAGIKNIATVDQKIVNYLGFFMTATTIVTGE